MFRKIVKLALFLTALWGVGRIVSQRLSYGGPDADEFSIATICGGVDRTSTAPSLRRGEVLAYMGGVDLDLTEATLDPDGAALELRACMGGVNVTVPDTWRVTVEAEQTAGGVETQLAPVDELPDDAPSLGISARVLMGGVMVAARPHIATTSQ
jgi:Cell wall-active antibiotics response LiaF, C-terminal